MKRTHDGNEGELRSYSIGLAIALLLTAISFALVAWPMLDKQASLAVIASAALVQALVHLRYFLRINVRSTPRENFLALAFAVVLVVIMIGGSFWIMMDLHHRMAARWPEGDGAPALRVRCLIAAAVRYPRSAGTK